MGQTKRRPPLPHTAEGHGYQTYELIYWEEKPMKAWLSFLATAVVCVSAFAQQPPPDVKQKVDSLIAKLRDAYVKNDAAAYARAFTSDGHPGHSDG